VIRCWSSRISQARLLCWWCCKSRNGSLLRIWEILALFCLEMDVLLLSAMTTSPEIQRKESESNGLEVMTLFLDFYRSEIELKAGSLKVWNLTFQGILKICGSSLFSSKEKRQKRLIKLNPRFAESKSIPEQLAKEEIGFIPTFRLNGTIVFLFGILDGI